MKQITYIIILFLIGCNQKNIEKSTKDIRVSNSQYKIEYQNLIDSLKYDYDGRNADYRSHLQQKVIAIGKPIIPFLLEKLDDTTKTQKFMNMHGINTAVGDNARSYIYDIYYNIKWSQYKDLNELNRNFLNPSEEEILIKIMPDIKKYENSANINLYWIYIYNSENKMPEQERRERYKEEFIKALNKDLLKP